jgi:hypothetical protein
MKKLLLLCLLFLGITTVSNAQMHAMSKPEEKAMELQKKLKLTDPQCKKIAAIYTESSTKFDKIKAENKGDNTKMLVAIEPLRASTIKQIKGVLTPAQSTKYEALVKSSKASGGTGWSDGWSASK